MIDLCKHHRIVSVGQRPPFQSQPQAEAAVVESDLRAIKFQLREGALQRSRHVECVPLARVLDPWLASRLQWNETVDVGGPGGQIERQHDGAEWPDVLDPRLLDQEGRKIIVGDDHDRVIGRMAREDHRADTGLIRLVRDGIEAGEIEDVVRNRRDDAVKPTRLQGLQQPVEIAEPFRERFSRKSRSTRRADRHLLLRLSDHAKNARAIDRAAPPGS